MFFWLLAVGVVDGQQPVFTSGMNGYKFFRRPAVVRLSDGRLLAFCEGRRSKAEEWGDKHIVMRMSSDDGGHWSSLRVVTGIDTLLGSDPAPVVDVTDPVYPQGRLFLFYNTGRAPRGETGKGAGERLVWYITSVDGGVRWSAPVNITSMVSRAGQGTYTNMPGHAVQLMDSSHRGRIVVAAKGLKEDPRENSADRRRVRALYTDDHGRSFHSDEDEVSYERRFPGAARQGSWLALDGGRTLAFCGDADVTRRDSLILRISDDGGNSWGPAMLIDGGGAVDHAGFSDLVDLAGGNIGVLYERDNSHELIFTEVDGVAKGGKALSRQQWDVVEGVYQLRGNPDMFIRFTDRDGELVAGFLWDFRIEVRFVPDSALVFIPEDGGNGRRNRISFQKDMQGQVERVTMGNGTKWDRVNGTMEDPEKLKILAGEYQSVDDSDNRIAIIADADRLVVKQVWDGAETILTPLSGTFFFSARPFFTLQVLSSGEGDGPRAVKIMSRYIFLNKGK